MITDRVILEMRCTACKRERYHIPIITNTVKTKEGNRRPYNLTCPICKAENSLEIIRIEVDTRYLSAKDAAELMTDKLNALNPGNDIEEFVKVVNKEHRTIQQKVFKLVVALCKNWSNNFDKGYYDDRNQATVKRSKDIMAIEDIESIPFI